MNSWDDVAAFALSLPATEASTSWHQPAIRTAKRMCVSTGHEPGSFHCRAQAEEKALLLETDPDSFWQTPHYANWPGLLIRYGSSDPDRVRLVITRAWWDAAPARSRKGFGDRP